MAVGDVGSGWTLEGFLRDSIRAGESMRTSRTRFEAAGGHMGNQAFRRAFALQRDAMALGPRLADIDTRMVPTRDMFTDWRSGAAGRRMARVVHDVFDPSIGEIVQQHWLVEMTDDMSIQDAIDKAVDQYEFGEGDDGPYKNGRITTSQVVELRYTV